MTEELRDRLARLDPMHSGVQTTPTTETSPRELLENIMSTPLKDKTEPAPAHKRTFAFAAAAALVLAVAGAFAFLGGGTLALNAGGEDTFLSCIVFSPDELDKVAELAFAGTVTAVDGPTVTLSVDHWFRGGEASEVTLNAPLGLEALIGGVAFDVGGEYLISAQDGNVNYCGFSGETSADYRAAWDEAFAQG